MRIGVEGCGVLVWFGKYTDIASLVLLFDFTHPICHLSHRLRCTIVYLGSMYFYSFFVFFC